MYSWIHVLYEYTHDTCVCVCVYTSGTESENEFGTDFINTTLNIHDLGTSKSLQLGLILT